MILKKYYYFERNEGEKIGVLICLFLCTTKNIIQWLKNMHTFRGILAIKSQLMWAPHLWEERSDIFLRKK